MVYSVMLAIFFLSSLFVSFYIGVFFGRDRTQDAEATTTETKEEKWAKYEEEMLRDRQKKIDEGWNNILTYDYQKALGGGKRDV